MGKVEGGVSGNGGGSMSPGTVLACACALVGILRLAESHKSGQESKDGKSAGHESRGSGGGGDSSDAGCAREGEGTSVAQVKQREGASRLPTAAVNRSTRRR